jgi:hypothetical protein
VNSEGRGLEISGSGLSARQIGLGLGLLFAVVLAVIVGKQMSTEAMAVVIGIVCGLAASIPTAVLLWVVLTRRDRHIVEDKERKPRERTYPPVVVVQGGAPQALPYGAHPTYWTQSPNGPTSDRQFSIVGGEDLLLDG